MSASRWFGAALSLAVVVLLYRTWLHANVTTVALTMLLLVLFLAARWGLRYAVVTSVAAAVCYNFFFLPPLGTLTISDPENWLAAFAFLTTAVVGSRLSERARREAREAKRRQSEVETLFTLSRDLLQTENVSALLNVAAPATAAATGAKSVLLYLLDGDRIYRTADSYAPQLASGELRTLALTLVSVETIREGEAHIPLRAGVRPRGLIVLHGTSLSKETLEAVGGLISVSIDRAQALEEVTRGEATKESERLRTLMIDSITHELRTPLTSIKASATTLLTGTLSADDQRELLTVIDEESDRLNRLVSQAVEMSQLDTQEVRMTFSSTEIGAVVERAMQTCGAVLEGHPLQVTLPAVPPVRADGGFLEKVMINLLENAAKYSSPGSEIFIAADRRGDAVALTVADRGIGIDSGEQAFIFDRFYRGGKTDRQVSGTGMGLAISKAIMEAHHGSLTVTSQPGQGSVFTLTLPIA